MTKEPIVGIFSSITDTLKKVVPVVGPAVATAVGGPVAGAGVSALTGMIGASQENKYAQ